MTEITKHTVLTEYADVLRRDLNPTSLAIYLEQLEPYSVAEVRAAMRTLADKSKWFPTPAEVVGEIRDVRTVAKRRRDSRGTIGQAQGRITHEPFRRPEGVSIMQHITTLQAQGLTSEEIAERICGGEASSVDGRYTEFDEYNTPHPELF